VELVRRKRRVRILHVRRNEAHDKLVLAGGPVCKVEFDHGRELTANFAVIEHFLSAL
jgi:hypothetical protein